MDEKRLAFLRSTVHPALSVLAPFLFLTAVDALLRALFLDSVLGVPPLGYRLVLLAAGVVEALSANALGKARATGIAPRFREAVLLLAASGLVLHLLSGMPFRGPFSRAAPGAVWALVLVAVQWTFSLAMHRVWIGRELYLSLLVGKAEGRPLANAAREAGGEATQLQEGIARLRLVTTLAMILLFLALFIGLMTGTSGGGGLGVGLRLYVLAVLAGGTAHLAFLRHVEAENDAFTDGMPIPAPMRGKRLRGLAVILALLLCAAFLLAGGHEILPLRLLADFFNWLGRVLTPPPTQARQAPPPKAETKGGDNMDMARALQALGSQKDNPFVAALVRWLGIAIGAALAAAFLVFLVRPLLSRDTRAAIRKARPLSFLAGRIRAFFRAVRSGGTAFGAWLRSPRTRTVGVARAALEGLREAAARRREGSVTASGSDRARETGRAVREYLRLLRWGRRAGVGFHGSMGPAAYAAALGEAVPRAREALGAAAALFEELAYSPRGDNPALQAALARTVNGIVRTKPERKGSGQ